MIQVKDIEISYGTLKAVSGISFRVGENTCFGLLGPNGAGKTTTINALMGLLKPDKGEIEILGKRPGQPEVLLQTGFCPQKIAVYEALSARENLAFFGRVYGLSRDALEKRVDYVLELVGLDQRAEELVSRFSGGMKRRLNLAISIVHDPKILFLDEPTVGVDPQSRNRIFENIDYLKSKGTTVIYTTHYMEEAERLCDEIAIMDHGKILAQGSLEKLLSDYGDQSVIEGEYEGGQAFAIHTAAPEKEILGLLGKEKAISKLKIQKPNLEYVFLKLTGRRLRDQ